MSNRLVQQNAGPTRPKNHRHLASRRRYRFQIDQSLAQRFIDAAPPGVFGDVFLIADTTAGAIAATFLPVTFADNNADVESDQGPDIGDAAAVSAEYFNLLQDAVQRGRDLSHPRILVADV